MEALTAVHLFSFVPVVAFGGVIWFERHHRAGGHIRTVALFRSLVVMAVLGVFQTLAWVLRGGLPLVWPQLLLVSGSLYALALLLLEYSIHAQRIEESFQRINFFTDTNELDWLAGDLAYGQCCAAASIAICFG